jgi:outer membrane protein
MRLLPALSLLAVIAPCASAQAPRPPAPDGGPTGPAWSLGVGLMMREGIYAGEDTNIIPIPFVGYEGEKFYFHGLSGGYHAIDNGVFSLDLELGANPGVSSTDLGRAELARNGINRDHLEDRDWAFDAGVSAKLQGPAGQLKFDLKTDIADVSGGQELGLTYEYPIFLGRTMISPSIGVQYLTEDRADYYYGTLDTEVARGAIDYKPGAMAIPRAGVSAVRQLNEKWTAFGMIDYSLMPDEMKDSPLMDRERDGFASVLFALTRTF